MTGRLAGKSALVTGAASGFGAAIARTFAREGARVTILDLDETGGARIAGEIGEAAVSLAGDVTKRADFDRAIARAADHGGRLDILVNNAGWTHRNKPLEEVSEEEFDRVYAINVKSIFHSVQASLPVFAAQKSGTIVNIGSTAGIRPRPGLTWYNGSKGAVNLLTRSLAVELAPHGVRVNAVAPVIGATALLESFMGLPDTPENRAKFIATIPLGRLSESEDVANACLYLSSDEAKFITGVVLEVDGGRTI